MGLGLDVGAQSVHAGNPVIPRVGDYELVRRIGAGGMAEVWMGRRTGVGGATKSVAVKFIIPSKTTSERHREMFLSEARLSMMLSHSNVIQVFDAGEDDGRLYMVMEWVDGMNLSQLLTNLRNAGKKPSLSMAGYIIGEILKGLAYAHNIFHDGRQITIVHRDISPQNVLVSVSGEVKLLDFGVARLAQEETSGIHIKGKLRYMAPEHLGGSSKAPTVDIYGAGAILHELIDGEKFRAGSDEMQLYNQILGGDRPDLTRDGVPAQLAQLHAAMLDPDEHARVGSADLALEMLEDWPGYRSSAGEVSRMVRGFMGVDAPRSGIHRAPTPAPGPGTIDSHAITETPTAATNTRGGRPGTHPELSQPGTDPSAVPVQAPTMSSEPLMVVPAKRSALPLWLGLGAGLLVAVGGVATVVALKKDKTETTASADGVDEASAAKGKDEGTPADADADAPSPADEEPDADVLEIGGPADADAAAGADEAVDAPGEDAPAADAGDEAEPDAEPEVADDPPKAVPDKPRPRRGSRSGQKRPTSKPAAKPASKPQPPKPAAVKVKVSFKLKSPLKLAYVKVDGGKQFVLQPMARRTLGVGTHSIMWRPSEDRPFNDGGKVTIREDGGHTVRISSSGAKVE